MNTKYLLILIIIPVLLMVFFHDAIAWQHGKPVTPYGDFCRRCSQYGICRTTMSTEDSEMAMVDYYNKKDLDVVIENVRGRFIKAKIMDRDKVIDVIIFDRRTGRIRSIY